MKSAYLEDGEIPVIDQGRDYCAGYTNDCDLQYNGPLPLTIFGDHTRIVKWVDKSFAVGADGTQLLRADDRFDQRYFYYALKSVELEHFGYERHFKYLKEEEIPLPDLPTQRKIAGILSAYDDLIENNLRRIKILEQMAQSLYREWFVHFRFPGHESATFKDSELGRIPEGWEVKEFREVFEIRYGKTLPKTQITENGAYPVYGAGSVIGFYHKPICLEKCALVTSRGNGSGTVWRTREAAFITNNSLIILPKEYNRTWEFPFVELLLRSSNVMSAKTGSAQPQVTIENLNYVEAIVPLEELVVQFCNHVSPMYEAIDCVFKKNQTLRRTRDLLLPKLLSPSN